MGNKPFISRTMSTQHPDNVCKPFFADNGILGGADEIKEAFYAFSHINSHEQLWDCEGKEVDNFVVKKLLSNYEPFFRKNILGKNKIISLRCPNPNVEKSEGKLLLEALNSIPRSFDIARLFYGEDIPPIYEVFIPMVTSSKDIIRVKEFYKQHVSGKQHKSLIEGDGKISDWLGRFIPEDIQVTPLIEDKDNMLRAAEIAEKYIETEKVEGFQRVWLARSDPALNYSNIATVLAEKVSLQRLYDLQERTSVDIYPILGCGSAPFRGNFRPTNASSMMKGYPSVHTFTIQSAFKYDYPIGKVRDAVDELNNTTRKKPIHIEEKRAIQIMDKCAARYQEQIQILAPMINSMARLVPGRRKRKLHVGLFGYSRSQDGISLPRAIKFCASFYSLGLPPEILGCDVLTEKDLEFISDVYPSLIADYKDAMKLLNKDNLGLFPQEIQKAVEKTLPLFDFEIDERHKKITGIIANDWKHDRPDLVTENIERAGFVRGYLG